MSGWGRRASENENEFESEKETTRGARSGRKNGTDKNETTN
jgi:hypothetical protein